MDVRAVFRVEGYHIGAEVQQVSTYQRIRVTELLLSFFASFAASAFIVMLPLRAILERRRRFRRGPYDFREAAALQELAAFAAASGHFISGRADGLLGTPRGFDGQQIPVAGGRD